MDTASGKVSFWLRVFTLGMLTSPYTPGVVIGVGIHAGNLVQVGLAFLLVLLLFFLIGFGKPWRRPLAALLSLAAGIFVAIRWPERNLWLYTAGVPWLLIVAGAVGVRKAWPIKSRSLETGEKREDTRFWR